MTLNELRESVLSLGFEDGFDTEELFKTAVRRALHTLYIDRPRIRQRSLILLSPLGTLISGAFVHTGGAFERFTMRGRAYSFKVAGDGYYTVTDADGERTEHFDKSVSVVRGFIKQYATITFYGECDYLVFALAVFERRLSDTVDDIAVFGERRQLTLSEIFPDFLAAHKLPTDKYGFELADAKIKDSVLTLPYGFTGEIFVSYKRRASLPSFDDGDEVLDVSSECEELLPLLVASYVWLDDDSSKAEFYLSLYKDMLSTLKKNNSRYIESTYITNRWA